MTALPAQKPPHLPALDGLRAVAIGLVLWHHAPVVLVAPRAVYSSLSGRLGATGWMGVDLFFVLSGFLITGILLRGRDHRGALGTFLWRRALRIFPLAYLYLGLLYATAKLLDFPALLGRYGAWKMWALYAGNVQVALHGWTAGSLAILWSLAIEEQFYLVWPLVVLFLPRRWLLSICLVLIALSPVVRWLIYARLGYPAVYVLTFCRIDTLAAGAALAILMADNRLRPRALAVCRIAAVPALCVLALTLGHPFGKRYPGLYPPWFPIWGYSWIGLSFAVIVGLCVEPGPVVTRLLVNRAMRYVGKVSYGLYIWHYLVGEIVMRETASRLSLNARLGLWLSATLAVASLSWLGFERPILRLKDRSPRRI